MTSRERLRAIISGRPADRCGFWLGNPHPDTWPIYLDYFRVKTQEELKQKLHDDYRWVQAGGNRKNPGKGFFPVEKLAHGAAGPFADAKDAGDIESYPWPAVEDADFSLNIQALQACGEHYRGSGLWTSFYHTIMDLFGMESYLVNMYENPALVHAVTDRVCQFFYDANERFYAEAGHLTDGYFFGNDFGTQLDLICGPDQFDEFIMPWFRRYTEQAHRHGKQVILHSCGSIHKVIDRLIDAKVDCLHPLQALARNMDAGTLARDFKGRIAFMGGIDTQDLLVNATPREVKADVRRVKKLLGPRLIVSPSHEALLPNVPPQNVLAMAEAAVE